MFDDLLSFALGSLALSAVIFVVSRIGGAAVGLNDFLADALGWLVMSAILFVMLRIMHMLGTAGGLTMFAVILGLSFGVFYYLKHRKRRSSNEIIPPGSAD